MGTWTNLGKQEAADVMLLLTDGTVMVWGIDSDAWRRFRPSANGGYENGTWSMPKAIPGSGPHGAAVLASGKVFKFDPVQPKIYDPVVGAWSDTAAPPHYPGETKSELTPSLQVLADGRLMFLTAVQGAGERVVLYNPKTDHWAASHADWIMWLPQLLLPDSRVFSFTDDSPGPGPVVPYPIFDPHTGVVSVVSAQPPNLTVKGFSPVLLLPDGRALAFAQEQPAFLFFQLDTATTATLSQGPVFPAVDSHGLALAAVTWATCLLPNGNVLCCAEYSGSLKDGADFGEALVFYELDLSNGGAALVAQENAAFRRTTANAAPHFQAPRAVSLVLLPTGQVLVSTRAAPNGEGMAWLYTPTQSAPLPEWKPTLDVCPTSLIRGSTVTFKGRQLNGLAQAVSQNGGLGGHTFGFGTQNASNYPLLEFSSDSAPGVRYLRTSNFSSMGVATGPNFVVRFDCEIPNLPLGHGKIRVITNGIASDYCETVIIPSFDHRFELAIDPMALILSPAAYLIWVELHHPHVENAAQVAEAVQSMSPAERKAALGRALTLVEYGNAVATAISDVAERD